MPRKKSKKYGLFFEQAGPVLAGAFGEANQEGEPIHITNPQGNNKNKTYILIVICFFIAVIFGISIFYIRNNIKDTHISDATRTIATSSPLIVPSSAPKTIRPIIKGVETYRVSFGKDVLGPKPEKVVINPHDPKVDEVQTLTVFFSKDVDVSKIKVTTFSDNNKSNSYDLISQRNGQKDGEWSGSWKIDNTHLYNYSFSFEMLDSKQNVSKFGISIR